MKTTILLLFLSFIQVMGSSSYSQNTRVSLNMDNVRIEKVLSAIENQSDYYFLYNEKLVNVKQMVDVNVKNELIKKVLSNLFDGTGVEYVVVNNQILLSPKNLLNGFLKKQGVNQAQQQITVTGTVTDEKGNPLPGVNIVVKGTTHGTVTDANGKYSFSIPPDATLVFSFVGYKKQEVPVAGKNVINVTLTEEAIGLEEVLAIGYGTMKRSDLTGSVSQVKTDILESVPVFNMEQALKIGATGVRVSQNSGMPGGRIEVRIRGGNSMIGDNAPLYVVDGFAVTGGIDFLNPSDIESVDILKDASATAIYGSRGANGVVIITSKRGKYGQKGKIEINSYVGLQKETKRYDLCNAKEYAILANEWLKNGGLEPYFNVDTVKNPGTDWQDVIFRNAPIQNHTVTFTSGSDKTRYSFSVNYYDQKGILINSGVKRGSARINLDHKLNNWLTMGLNLQLSRSDRRSVYSDNGFRGTGLLSAAASAPPTLPVYNKDGLPTQIEQAYNFGSADMRNPLIFASTKNRRFVNEILGNSTFDVKITPVLTFKTLLGLQYGYTLGDYFTPIIYSSDRGSASTTNSYHNSFLNENTFTYKKVFNNIHKLNMVGGFTYQTSMYRNSGINVSGFANNITENYDLSAAQTIGNPSSGYSDWTLASFLARTNYSLYDKYMVTLSIRADGSSRFGADHKWGYFPSGALAWRVSEESFMQNITLISNLKLRASYGITGNTALSPYQSLNRLSSVKYIYRNHDDYIGYVPVALANPDLKWETTKQLDIGMDINILKDRLRFVFDYYKKDTKDLLASVPLPPSVGFGSMLRNIGEIQNKGIEFSVDADILKGEFKWNASVQISSNKNKVTKLAGGSDIYGAEQFAAWPSANIARIGEPLGAFYGFLEDGLDNNGFIKYKDVNGPDGKPDGVVNSLDRVILGSYYPDFIYSFISNFTYKNFELYIALDGVYGNKIFNATNGTLLNSFQRGNNQLKDIIGNYWTAENPNPNAKYPKISSATQITVSDRFIEDGSYLRIKSLRLAYNLPFSKWRMPVFDKAQIYVSGTNLFTLTKYTGLDPDVNTRGTDYGDVSHRIWIGVDQFGYPNAKIYAIGLKLDF